MIEITGGRIKLPQPRSSVAAALCSTWVTGLNAEKVTPFMLLTLL